MNSYKIKLPEGQITFKINGRYFNVDGNVPATTTLNTFIRNYAHAKGTKSMCEEGGCGVCIVAVEKTNMFTQETEIFAVNSCLVPVYVCHGWNIITIEGIGNQRSGFHKIQSTLAGFDGTQCGYCTPGMVMNMFSLLSRDKTVTMERVENSFGGNICRCTGYRPILEAFKSLARDASADLKKKCADIEDLIPAAQIRRKTNEEYANSCLLVNGDASECRGGGGGRGCKKCLSGSFKVTLADQTKWFRVRTIGEIFDVLKAIDTKTKYMLVAGHTSHGVYGIAENVNLYIDVNVVKELREYRIDTKTGDLLLGANMSLTNMMNVLETVAAKKSNHFGYLKALVDHIDLVANVSVRNTATIAGNLTVKHDHHDFPSDIFLILEAIGATLTIGGVNGKKNDYSLQSYLKCNMHKKVILNVNIPKYDSSYTFRSYKIMQRAQNTHAYVNAAFLMKVNRERNFLVEQEPNIVFGGINNNFVHAPNTENFLSNKTLSQPAVLKEACKILQTEIVPDQRPTDGSPDFRRSLAVNLFYKAVLSILADNVSPKYKSGGTLLRRPLSSAMQDFQTDSSIWPMTKPVLKLEAFSQCSGEVEYVNDIPSAPNELYAAFVLSTCGPAEIERIDTSPIAKMDGVVKFLTAKDIPGKNTFVEVLKTEDALLLAENEIKFAGQPVGIVIAENQIIANAAAEKVVVRVKNVRKPVLNLVKLAESKDPVRVALVGQITASHQSKNVKQILSGTLSIEGQYHYTLEPHTCYCVPTEDGIDVYPSSQWINAVQVNVAEVLAMPVNSVNVSVRRLGGAYGSKSRYSSLTACGCALAAYNVNRPVRMVMSMKTNMEAIGKRHSHYGKYEVAIDGKGKIQRLNLDTYSNHGHTVNDSLTKEFPNFATRLYRSEVLNMNSYTVKTDIPSNTFCRTPGPSVPVAFIEHVMEHIAHATKMDPIELRCTNIPPQHASLKEIIESLRQKSDYNQRKESINAFNGENRWKKRGLGLTTMCYSWFLKFPFHALLSVFAHDGTVAVTHGGIEMGQGLNTKVVQACAYTLGIDMNLIRIKSSTALTSPNDGRTAGCWASDGVVLAVIECGKILTNRLKPIKERNPSLEWKDLVKVAHAEGIDLCCEYMNSQIKTPRSYDIYGAAITEVEVDLLTGQHVILRVDLMEDVGQSISPQVDIGQVEGAFVMGLGYWLNEKLTYDEETGKLLTNRSWNYTPPGAKDIPADFRVYFCRKAPNPSGVLRAKATGEAPFCLSVSAVFAVRNALAAARLDSIGTDEWFDIKLPYTPENVLLSLKTDVNEFELYETDTSETLNSF